MNQLFDNARGAIQNWTGVSADVQWRLFETAVVLMALLIVRWIVQRILRRTVDDPRSFYQWRKIASYTIAVVGLLAITRIWFAWFGDLGTFLGLAAAGLAIAMRDVIVNLVAWLFIVSRRPFSVGDRIQVGNVSGDVVDQRLFQFTLLEIGNWVQADQSTGRIVHVPNGKVFTEPQFNYTRGFSYIWNELRVTVTFESDWRKARELLQEIVTAHAEHLTEDARERIVQASRNFMIVYSSFTPIVYTEVRENGVLLTMRYLTDPRRRRGTAHAIWEDVLDAFHGHDDIAFAYPTTRVFEAAEGKLGPRRVAPDKGSSFDPRTGGV